MNLSARRVKAGLAAPRVANQRCYVLQAEANEARGKRLHFHVGFLRPPVLSVGYKHHSGGPHLHAPIFLQEGDNLQEANDSSAGASGGGRRASALRRDRSGCRRCGRCGWSLP